MGGHANLIPAHSCFLDVMGGPPDGTGSVLTYNRASCYEADPLVYQQTFTARTDPCIGGSVESSSICPPGTPTGQPGSAMSFKGQTGDPMPYYQTPGTEDPANTAVIDPDFTSYQILVTNRYLSAACGPANTNWYCNLPATRMFVMPSGEFDPFTQGTPTLRFLLISDAENNYYVMAMNPQAIHNKTCNPNVYVPPNGCFVYTGIRTFSNPLLDNLSGSTGCTDQGLAGTNCSMLVNLSGFYGSRASGDTNTIVELMGSQGGATGDVVNVQFNKLAVIQSPSCPVKFGYVGGDFCFNRTPAVNFTSGPTEAAPTLAVCSTPPTAGTTCEASGTGGASGCILPPDYSSNSPWSGTPAGANDGSMGTVTGGAGDWHSSTAYLHPDSFIFPQTSTIAGSLTGTGTMQVGDVIEQESVSGTPTATVVNLSVTTNIEVEVTSTATGNATSIWTDITRSGPTYTPTAKPAANVYTYQAMQSGTSGALPEPYWPSCNAACTGTSISGCSSASFCSDGTTNWVNIGKTGGQDEGFDVVSFNPAYGCTRANIRIDKVYRGTNQGSGYPNPGSTAQPSGYMTTDVSAALFNACTLDSTIAISGSISGTINFGDIIEQEAVSGKPTANVLVPTVPFTVSNVTGTPTSSGVWTDLATGATFTPSATPVAYTTAQCASGIGVPVNGTGATDSGGTATVTLSSAIIVPYLGQVTLANWTPSGYSGTWAASPSNGTTLTLTGLPSGLGAGSGGTAMLTVGASTDREKAHDGGGKINSEFFAYTPSGGGGTVASTDGWWASGFQSGKSEVSSGSGAGTEKYVYNIIFDLAGVMQRAVLTYNNWNGNGSVSCAGDGHELSFYNNDGKGSLNYFHQYNHPCINNLTESSCTAATCLGTPYPLQTTGSEAGQPIYTLSSGSPCPNYSASLVCDTHGTARGTNTSDTNASAIQSDISVPAPGRCPNTSAPGCAYALPPTANNNAAGYPGYDVPSPYTQIYPGWDEIVAYATQPVSGCNANTFGNFCQYRMGHNWSTSSSPVFSAQQNEGQSSQDNEFFAFGTDVMSTRRSTSPDWEPGASYTYGIGNGNQGNDNTVSPEPTVITETSISSDVLTVYTNNNYANGAPVVLTGTAESFLNGQTVTVAGSTGTTFTANFTHTNYTNTSDTGLADDNPNRSIFSNLNAAGPITGTVTVTNGNPTVTWVSGTQFTTGNSWKLDTILIGTAGQANTVYTIASVGSATQLTLQNNVMLSSGTYTYHLLAFTSGSTRPIWTSSSVSGQTIAGAGSGEVWTNTSQPSTISWGGSTGQTMCDGLRGDFTSSAGATIPSLGTVLYPVDNNDNNNFYSAIGPAASSWPGGAGGPGGAGIAEGSIPNWGSVAPDYGETYSETGGSGLVWLNGGSNDCATDILVIDLTSAGGGAVQQQVAPAVVIFANGQHESNSERKGNLQ
jgi:hypothetical protein